MHALSQHSQSSYPAWHCGITDVEILILVGEADSSHDSACVTGAGTDLCLGLIWAVEEKEGELGPVQTQAKILCASLGFTTGEIGRAAPCHCRQERGSSEGHA